MYWQIGQREKELTFLFSNLISNPTEYYCV